MSSFLIPESAQAFIGCNVAPSTDREGVRQTNTDGVALWEVRVVAVPEAEPGRDRVPMPDVLRVQLPAAVQPVVVFGQAVVFPGLTVRTWAARDGRQGLMYTAESVRPTPAPAGERPRPAAGPVREQHDA
jgi:hypothetical protein